MPTYVIERHMPGAGDMSQDDLRGASQHSCSVIRDMDERVRWVQSYVTGDCIYCVYESPDEAAIREHAEKSGFPANKISEVKSVISPATAE